MKNSVLGGIAAVIVVGIISALVILQDDYVIEEDVTESKEIDPSTSDLSQFAKSFWDLVTNVLCPSPFN